MKTKKINWKWITIFILLLFLSALIFAPVFADDTYEHAKVERIEGMYIFILSKPTANYTYLGSEKIRVSLTGSPQELFKTMIKKVRKQYPQANGIIFNTIELDYADAIKF